MNDELANSMTMLMMAGMLNALDGIHREFITLQLEAKLRHSLTWYNWQTYQQAEAERERLQAPATQQEQALAPWDNFRKQLQQMANEQRIIRDFVWGVDTESQAPITYETLLAAARRAVKNGRGEE